jgi:hypothetical protein
MATKQAALDRATYFSAAVRGVLAYVVKRPGQPASVSHQSFVTLMLRPTNETDTVESAMDRLFEKTVVVGNAEQYTLWLHAPQVTRFTAL